MKNSSIHHLRQAVAAAMTPMTPAAPTLPTLETKSDVDDVDKKKCDVKIIISTEVNGRTIAQRTEKVPPPPLVVFSES